MGKEVPEKISFNFLKLNLYSLIYYNVSSFLELNKLPALFDETFSYLSLKKNTLNFVETIIDKYSTQNEDDEMRTRKFLIFYFVALLYDALDFKDKAIEYYEKSLFYKMNIFALDNLIDSLSEDDETLYEAQSYFLYAKNKFKIDETEYWLFLTTIATLFEDENKRTAEEYYNKAIKIIENQKYKTIDASYPYFNLALLKKEFKDYKIAEQYFLKALDILQDATNIKLKKPIPNNITYFLEDFQDYLYEVCNVKILQNDKSLDKEFRKYSELIYRIIQITARNNLNDERASLKYDISLLESKYYDSKKNYKKAKAVIENCLTTEESYLSKEQKADLKARLAYFYYKMNDLERYKENILKALELDPENESALKLMAQISISRENTEFLSKKHIKKWVSQQSFPLFYPEFCSRVTF